MITTKRKFRIIQFHSIHIAFLLFLLVLLGSLLAGSFLLKQETVVHVWDENVYSFFVHSPHHPLIDLIIHPFNFGFLPNLGPAPSYFYVMNLVFLGYMFWKKRSLFIWSLIAVIVANILSQFVSGIIWANTFRPRPFLSLPNNLSEYDLSIWKGLPSFPSGHVRDTALYATIYSAFIPEIRWLMVLFTLFIAYSRLYLGAHYPSDVIAGMVIGYAVAKSTLMILREVQLIIRNRFSSPHTGKPLPEKVHEE